MTWVALGISLLGVAANQYNTQQTAKKQDRALAAQITQQGQKQQQASAKIAEALAAQAKSDSTDEQSQQMDSYLRTLAQGQQAEGINSGPGGFSQAYREGTEQAGQALGEYGNTRAGLLSRVDAPRLQRQNEGILFDSLRNELGMIGREASGDDYLARLRYGGIKRDPWLDALSSVATSYGKGMAGAGGGGAGTAPVSGNLLTQQASTGPGSIYNFGNNIDGLRAWGG